MSKLKSLVPWLLPFLLGINFVYVTVGVFAYPLNSIDVFGIWLLKAKAIYLAGVNGQSLLDFLHDSNFSYSHHHYPLGLPILFALIYLVSGGVNELYVLLWSPVLYVAILSLSYMCFLKITGSSTWSLANVYIYSMFSPLLGQAGRMHAGSADIYITLLNWGVMYLVLGFFEQKPDFGKISSQSVRLLMIMALIMLNSQFKLEGIFAAAVLLFVPVPIWMRISAVLITVLPTLSWQFFITYHHITPDFGWQLPSSLIEMGLRLVKIVRLVSKELLNIKNWYIFWPLWLLALVVTPPRITGVMKVIVFSSLVMVTGFVANYWFSSIPIEIYLPSSFDRVLLQLSPWFMMIWVESSARLLHVKKNSI